MIKQIYWNVDTQKDFMDEDGALSVKGAQAILGNLETLTQYARDVGIKIVGSADWHNDDSAELSSTPDYKTTFPPHCIAGTPGADYIAQTRPDDPYIVDWDAVTFDWNAVKGYEEITIRKDAFDVFEGNPHTQGIVNVIDPERVVVYGVASDVCVDRAVRGLVDQTGIDVYVVSDAIKELPGSDISSIVRGWEALGARITTTDQVVRYGK